MDKRNSKTFKLMELDEELTTAIENATKVKEEQEELCSILENAKKTKHDFSDLIKSLKDQNKQIGDKIESMKLRKKFVNELLFIYNNGLLADAKPEAVAGSQFVDDVISKVMIALGLETYSKEEDKQE